MRTAMSGLATIHQPQYLPYIGTVAKVMVSDVFINYDNADYQKNYFDNRNRIMTKNGQIWLTIPVQAKLKQPIKDVKVSDATWRKKHSKTLRMHYGNAPYFDALYPLLDKIYNMESPWLVDFTNASWEAIFAYLGKRPHFVSSSALIDTSGMSSAEKLVRLTQAVNCEKYLSGPSWTEYMKDLSIFKNNGIEFYDCAFDLREYPSASVYAPYMSVIDLFFSMSPADSMIYINSVIKQNRIL